MTSSVNTTARRDAQKISRTFQDSNIFGMCQVGSLILKIIGNKDDNSATVTDNARREAQRPVKIMFDLRLFIIP